MTKGLSCVRAAYSYNAEIASNAGGVVFNVGGVALNSGVTTFNAGVTTLNSGGGMHYVGVLEEYPFRRICS